MQKGTMSERLWLAWDRAWNNGDVDALDEVFAPDYVRTSLFDKQTLDRTGMKSAIATVRESFPDMTTTIERIVETEDELAVLWSSVGTHLGRFRDVPPTGKPIETSGSSFFRMRDGLIVEEIETWDSRDILSTLGIHSLRSTRDA